MRVPTYDAPTVGANTLPQPQFRAAQFDASRPSTLRPVQATEAKGINTPDIAGRQLQQAGDQMQRIGQQIANMQIEAEREVNTLRVDDAMNRAKEAALRLTHDKEVGFLNLKGINALDRPDGKSLEDEYSDNLRKQIDEIGGSLGTEAQKSMFAARAQELAMGFRTNVSRHSSDEFRTYTLSVAEGVQATALNEIGLNYNNPEVVQGAVDRIKAQTYRQAQILGKSAEWQEAQARKMISGAHKVALMAALEKNDPEYANGYLAKFSKDIEADDQLQVRGAITKEMDARVSMTVVSDVMQRVAPLMDPGPAERAFNVQGIDMGKAFGALVKAESGGQQFGKDGKPLTSSAGAIGIAQVMPATGPEAAKLAGLPWDETRYRNDPAYNKALGLAYFQKQLQDNGGDLAKAYASYNAGPGRLREAVTKSRREGGNWIDHVPAETQAYVAKNMAAYEKGGGAPKALTFDDIDAILRADPRLANNPARYRVARLDAERQFYDAVKARKQREDESVSSALQGVIDNGGDFAGLPLAVRNSIPPDQVGKVMDLAEKLSKGQKVETNWSLYYELRSDPQKLAAVNLGTFKGLLADTEFKQLVDLQQSKDPIKTTVIRSAEEVLKSYMLQAGISPTGKNTDEAEKAGRVFSEFERRLNAFEVEQGKKATSKDAEQIAARMFTSVETESSWWNTTKRAYELTADDRIVVPQADRQQIIDALTKHKNPVTEASILALYRQQKGI